MFSFCIPYRYRPECDGSLTACLERLRAFDQQICIGGALQDGKFNRSAALNEAIVKADYEWIVALDVDMILPEDFLLQASSWVHSTPPVMLTFDFFERGRPRFPDNPGGAGVFSDAIYHQVGGFDERYEGYGYEDYDFCDRVLAAGFRVVNTHIPIEHIPHPQVEEIFEDLERNKAIYEGRK